MDNTQLLGTWHLARWEVVQGGRTSQPFGEGATGILLYTPDGHMSAAIMAAGRRAFVGRNPRTATMAEKAAAHDGYFHYSGRWQVIPGPRVVHQISHSLNPGFVGSEQIRDIHLQGDRLVLSAAEQLPGGITRHHRLIWRR